MIRCLVEHGIALNSRTRVLLGRITCDDILIVARELSEQKKAGETGLFVFRLEQRAALDLGRGLDSPAQRPVITYEIVDPEDSDLDKAYPIAPEVPPEIVSAWTAALDRLYAEMPKTAYLTWVNDTHLFSWDPDRQEITVGAANSYARDWLENHLTATLKNHLSSILNSSSVSVRFCVY